LCLILSPVVESEEAIKKRGILCEKWTGLIFVVVIDERVTTAAAMFFLEIML